MFSIKNLIVLFLGILFSLNQVSCENSLAQPHSFLLRQRELSHEASIQSEDRELKSFVVSKGHRARNPDRTGYPNSSLAGIIVGGSIALVGWTIIVLAWASNGDNFAQIQLTPVTAQKK